MQVLKTKYPDSTYPKSGPKIGIHSLSLFRDRLTNILRYYFDFVISL